MEDANKTLASLNLTTSQTLRTTILHHKIYRDTLER